VQCLVVGFRQSVFITVISISVLDPWSIVRQCKILFGT